MNDPISLDLHRGVDIRITPDAFMEQVRFQVYLRACKEAGARYSGKAHLLAVSAAPRLMAALRAAGFLPRMSDALRLALRQTAEAADAAVAGAAIRARTIEEVLRTAGKDARPYQLEGIAWLAPCPSALLADQQGLGKTLQAIAAAPADRPALVVGPANAKGVWSSEWSALFPERRTEILSGRDSFRWPAAGEALVLNYDILPPTPAEIEALELAGGVDDEAAELARRAWDDCPSGLTLILDECHAIKSNKTRRSERCRWLISEAWGAGGRVWGLTGTPLLNRPLELWTLLTALKLQNEAFGSFLTFTDMFGAVKNRWGAYEWPKDARFHHPEIAQRLKRVMLRRERADVAPQLPGKTREDVPVELDRAARACADAVVKALAERGIDVASAIEAAIAGRYATPGFAELSRVYTDLAQAMIPFALEIAKQYEEDDEPLLVWSSHSAPVEAFRGRKGWGIISGGTPATQRSKLAADFQAGKLLGLALNIQAGGVALTLTRAAHALFVDLDWTPALNEQAEDRIVRYGQTRGVIIKRLCPDHDLARRKLDIVTAKMGMVDAVIRTAAVAEGKAIPRVDAAALRALAEAP